MRRFRGQYRLRTLLLAVTCLAALLAHGSNHAHRRAQAIAVIRDAGGHCYSGPDLSNVQRWLGWLVSADSGEPMSRVDLREARLSESLLEGLPVLAEVERLAMGGALPETWPLYVSRLRRLRHLELRDTSVHDHDLDMLRSWPQLHVLALENTEITEVALRDVGDCQSLTHLVLDESTVRDRDVLALAKLQDLHDLYLIDTPITNEALKTIGRLKSLRFLNLNRCRVSDDGLRFLRGLRQLEGIVLEGTAITDARLHHLQAMPALDDIHLGDTAVSDEAVLNFQLAIPRCKVNR